MEKQKILTDVHTHTKFSPDGRATIEEMLDGARKKGVFYYGISEHFDYDCLVNGIHNYGSDKILLTDADGYFSLARELQKAYGKELCVLVGAEFGFTDNPKALPIYEDFIKKYRPDFIVNSVHTEGTNDYYYGAPYFEKDGVTPKSKKAVYEYYFDLVKKSAEVEYEYDILGHLGYCTRYAPYEDKRALLSEFSDEIDGVLKVLIARKKILEVNSSNKAGDGFLPSAEILARYYALGGRKISFASDAHDVGRIAEKREEIVSVLKTIGFTYITVPCKGEHIEVEI